MRGKLRLFFACSIDGYIAKRNGDVEWLGQFSLPGENYGYDEFLADIDVILLGRKSYEKVLTFPEFPYNKPCYVITSQKNLPSDSRVIFTSELTKTVTEILAEGKNIYADGGALLISELIKQSLVDEMTITTLPIILGNGVRCFKTGIGESTYSLQKIEHFPSGLIQVKYIKNFKEN
ncbi:MAG: dihydrofolate reductase [Neisseriales bacterium]|nr:MAG: dihydrofolate reductase [Neisseriales bacterium]